MMNRTQRMTNDFILWFRFYIMFSLSKMLTYQELKDLQLHMEIQEEEI